MSAEPSQPDPSEDLGSSPVSPTAEPDPAAEADPAVETEEVSVDADPAPDPDSELVEVAELAEVAEVVDLPSPGADATDVVDAVGADLTLIDTIAALEARLRTVSAAYQKQNDDVAATKERLARQAMLREELRRGEVVGTLFEPVENLRRSIEAIRKDIGEESAAGLDLVLAQFLEAFKKLGLEEVPGKGSRFDPTLHEALTMVPVTDPALDGAVIQVFETGYRIGSRLLKPSRVIIGQLQEAVGEA